MDSRAIKARLKQIFAAHSHDEICEFVEAYAYNNQALALALSKRPNLGPVGIWLI